MNDWKIDEARSGWLDVRLGREFRTNMKRILAHRDILVRLRIGDTAGWGEAYTMQHDAAEKALDGNLPLGRDPWDFDAILEPIADLPARAAVDIALHDALARKLGLPIYRFLGIPKGGPITSVTLSLGDDDEAVIREAREWVQRGFQCLKLKMGTATDPSLPLRIREAVGSGIRIRVDGNQAWTVYNAEYLFKMLKTAGVEFCEQPFPVGQSALCAEIRREIDLPIYLDEEITGPADVARVWRHGGVDGVNVKVAKCGGLRRSLETIRAARALGLKVMIGCYFETSLAIGAAVHLTGLADAVDLDAALFLAADPFRGLSYAEGRPVLEGPGTGLTPDEGWAGFEEVDSK
ncbi:MAG: dipeptide epimerase [Candidatus Eisenbacteria bacterium]|uniref:Dipeptide epimerase n=1 Tax=Eiseniibacteriota bacterium TaxID=2212470 RepID=A0A948W5V6_UNCEI|nr:dipeptide epimerase [Candidatus Eisenbacteria bacterium]MBU1947458.1 dipeptide epimerase [Candidatus Eisenbacteria bacterium]MBU2690849.1 dipeptide epimerase [Candidatus Eisenbacteria bacterium]